jgi:PhnB protein
MSGPSDRKARAFAEVHCQPSGRESALWRTGSGGDCPAASKEEIEMPVKPIPDGYQAVQPYLIVDGAAKAIAFYKNVLGAAERLRMEASGGRVGHAELTIGGSVVMLADEHPEIGVVGPRTVGGSPVGVMVYLPDVDAAVERALAAGARVVSPAEKKFYGDRQATIEDPFGHKWYLSTHVEDVPPDEIARRAAALHGAPA